DPHLLDFRLGDERCWPRVARIRQADRQDLALQAVDARTRLAGIGPRPRRETDRRRLDQGIGPTGPTHLTLGAHLPLVDGAVQDELPRCRLAVEDVLPILFDQAPGAAQLPVRLALPPGPGHGPRTRGAENGPPGRPDDQAQRLFFGVGKPAENQSESRKDQAPYNTLGHGGRASSPRRLRRAGGCPGGGRLGGPRPPPPRGGRRGALPRTA